MRTILFILSLFGLTLVQCIAQQTITVTPQTLDGWNVAGADRQALSSQSELSLPAGAQLARQFPTSQLTVWLVSRPRFGATPTDWPVIEIGSAALVFVRNNDTGSVILVLDEQEPVELPVCYPLDIEGRSLEPVSIGFSRAGTDVAVEVGGQVQLYAARPSNGAAMEVVASAGAIEPWEIAQFLVRIPSPAADTAASDSATSSDQTTSGGSDAIQPAHAGAEPRIVIGESGQVTTSTQKAGTESVAVGQPTRRLAFEIFTPPAVRHGRAAAVRSAVAKGQAKSPEDKP